MSRRIRRGFSSTIKFAYIDTNFYSFMKDDELRALAISYFNQQSLTPLVTLPHWAEIHRAGRQHSVAARFLDDTGALIVAPPMKEVVENLDTYPNIDHRRFPRVLGPVSAEVIEPFLGGTPVEGSPTGFSASVLARRLPVAGRARRGREAEPDPSQVADELEQAKNLARSREFINRVRSLSDPSNRVDFEDRWIIHYLLQTASYHPNFITLYPPLVPGSFPSLRVQAALIWWAQIRPSAKAAKPSASDLGDQMHSLYFCNCDFIVLEKQQREVLRQLQQSAPYLFKPSLVTFTTGNFIRMLRDGTTQR